VAGGERKQVEIAESREDEVVGRGRTGATAAVSHAPGKTQSDLNGAGDMVETESMDMAKNGVEAKYMRRGRPEKS
jgi:hypothetical protein